MFTRQHYRVIVGLIIKNTTLDFDIDRASFIDDLCKYFKQDNHLFDEKSLRTLVKCFNTS